MGGCGGLQSGIPNVDFYNFSFHEITTVLYIRTHQQMIVFNLIDIDENAELRIEGELVLIQ